jgi:hypothetical protein
MLFGSVNYEAERTEKGEVHIWLEERWINTHSPARVGRELERRDPADDGRTRDTELVLTDRLGHPLFLPRRPCYCLDGVDRLSEPTRGACTPRFHVLQVQHGSAAMPKAIATSDPPASALAP